LDCVIAASASHIDITPSAQLSFIVTVTVVVIVVVVLMPSVVVLTSTVVVGASVVLDRHALVHVDRLLQ
jgi:hypothetical protein